MIRRAAAETISDYEPLATRSSNLMLAATSHRAKNEIFESAVAWVEAGRTLAELGSKLLHNDYVHEGAQEILHAAACFLEARDHRLGQEQLDRFENLPQLNDLVKQDEYLRSEYGRIKKWSGGVRKEVEKALDEMREQMKEPNGAHRLKQTWIDRTLREIPGLLEVHWFASEKHWSRSEKSGNITEQKRSIEHNRVCIHLRPDRLGLRIVLVWRLAQARHFPEAIKTSTKTAVAFPDSAHAHWVAGWARLHCVVRHRGSKDLLPEAATYLKHAIKLGTQLSEPQLVATKCCLAWSLTKMGNEDEAEELLNRTIKEHSNAGGDLALLVLQAPRTRRTAIFLAQIPSVINRAWVDAVPAESVFAGAA